ncbi:MAG: phosphotransferase [Anaerolineaceae bacterium]
MQDYKTLTNQGKLRRLHNLARLGLSHYELKEPQLTFHGFETNLLYRVITAEGDRYMLRLAYPGWRSLTDLQSQALWVGALARDTEIRVPEILHTRAGERVLSLAVPFVPDMWHMTLMRWVPGRLLGHYLTGSNLSQMGRLFARLHLHGKAWQPPAGFTQRRFEHWLSRGEEDRISGVNALQTDSPGVPAAHQAWIVRMIQLVEEAYARVDRADLRVIHCDLWHDNIKLYHGMLCPFDFEDTVWGFRVHDIAMAMLDLLETVGEARYPAMLDAFREGYEAHLPWPEDPIEPFQIGRMLWVLNWVARHQSAYLVQAVGRHIPVFEHFQHSGSVILPKSQ